MKGPVDLPFSDFHFCEQCGMIPPSVEGSVWTASVVTIILILYNMYHPLELPYGDAKGNTPADLGVLTSLSHSTGSPVGAASQVPARDSWRIGCECSLVHLHKHHFHGRGGQERLQCGRKWALISPSTVLRPPLPSLDPACQNWFLAC